MAAAAACTMGIDGGITPGESCLFLRYLADFMPGYSVLAGLDLEPTTMIVTHRVSIAPQSILVDRWIVVD